MAAHWSSLEVAVLPLPCGAGLLPLHCRLPRALLSSSEMPPLLLNSWMLPPTRLDWAASGPRLLFVLQVAIDGDADHRGPAALLELHAAVDAGLAGQHHAGGALALHIADHGDIARIERAAGIQPDVAVHPCALQHAGLAGRHLDVVAADGTEGHVAARIQCAGCGRRPAGQGRRG
jgi:hypothetical protein